MGKKKKKDWKYYNAYIRKNFGQINYKGDKEWEDRSTEFFEMNGFHYEDAFNLDIAMAVFILPKLAMLRDSKSCPGCLYNLDKNGYPIYNKKAEKKWRKILSTMIKGFHLYLEKDRKGSLKWTKEEEKLWRKTLKYLTKYYGALWI